LKATYIAFQGTHYQLLLSPGNCTHDLGVASTNALLFELQLLTRKKKSA